MKVHLIKEKTIQQYVREQARSKPSFEEWIAKIREAEWESSLDIKRLFPSADFLGNGSSRVIFDIGGNNYRMICKCVFGKTKVHLSIKWIGTHAEYDRLCAERKQYTVSIY